MFSYLVYILFLCIFGVVCNNVSSNIFQMFDVALCKSKCSQEISHIEQQCDVHHCKCSNLSGGTIWKEEAFIYNPPPKLFCRTEHTLHLQWASKNFTTYFVETRENNSSWTVHEKWTSCGSLTIENLRQNTVYEVRMWGVSSNSQIYRTHTVHFGTLSTREHPLPVPKLQIKELLLVGNYYDAVVTWTPSKDMRCSYAIVAYSTSGADYLREFDLEEPPSSYEMRLPFLSFGENYTVEIAAVGYKESAKTSCSIIVPTCLESYKNLTICKPDPPQNISTTETCHVHTTEAFLCNINITWAKPNLIPQQYTVNLINFELPSLPDNSTKIELEIPGNATYAVVTDVLLEMHYEIILKAYSPAGASEPTVFYKKISPPKFRQKIWSPFEILIAILALIFAISGVGILLFIYRRKQVKQIGKQMNNLYLEDLKRKCLNNEEPIKLKIDRDYENNERDEWELDYARLSVDFVLGEGAFGIVKRGVLLKSDCNGKIDVAIKMLKESPTIEELRQFHQEIQIMKSVGTHPNLVSLIGCITCKNLKSPLLVVEYCAKGDLQSYLRKEWARVTNSALEVNLTNTDDEESVNQVFNKAYDLAVDSLQPVDLLSFARQIAMGMEYLSSLRVLHRDLAARNVLVCENKIVKISDFGLSRDVYQDNVYCKLSGGKLPIRWMAIESLTHQRYTTQSDVWSFGVLLWEIITLGEHPYPDIHAYNLLEHLKKGYRMKCPPNCNQELYRLMLNCWSENPKDRPTFGELRADLEKFLENVTAYVTVQKVEEDEE